MRRSLTVLLALGLAATGCGRAGEPRPETEHLTLQLKWKHQAQFAGFYAADAKGLYAREGLDVGFVEGGADVDLIGEVVSGRAAFGVAGADAIAVARSEGEPVRAVAVVYRRNPLVFVALRSSGIDRPQELAGKRVWAPLDSTVVLHAMLAKVGVPPGSVEEIVRLADPVEALASGRVDAVASYVTNQLARLRARGLDLAVIYPDDFGVHFYADTIFTTDATIAKDPALVRRFVGASLEGWTWAVEHPDAAADLSKRYDPEADREHERAFMAGSLPLVSPGDAPVGSMSASVWAGMVRTLRAQDALARGLDPRDAYTTRFLPRARG